MQNNPDEVYTKKYFRFLGDCTTSGGRVLATTSGNHDGSLVTLTVKDLTVDEARTLALWLERACS